MSVRWMSEEEAWQMLASGNEGRLATVDAVGQPYITPLNYVLIERSIYFHCKKTGRKLDNIAQNQRVCFEVSRDVESFLAGPQPCGCATRYRTVIAFGKARLIENDAEKARVLDRLTAAVSNGRSFRNVTEEQAATCAVVEICLDSISGKQNYTPEGWRPED